MAESHQGKGAANEPTGNARRLLTDCKFILQSHLSETVAPALNEARELLMTRAEQSRDSQEQGQILAATNLFHRRGHEFADALAKALEDSYFESLALPPNAEESRKDEEQTLALVDEDELEQSLAVDEMVNRAEVRYTTELFAITRRLTVLNGGRAVRSNNNPLGPVQIGRILLRAVQVFPVETSEKVTLLKTFGQLLLDRMGPCYEAVNELLVQAGILPNLRFEVDRKQQPAQGEGDAKGEDEDAEGGAGPRPRGRPRAPSSPRTERADTLTREVHEESEALLRQIRELLGRVRGPGAGQTGSGPIVSTQDIGMGLRDLQRQYAQRVDQPLDTDAIKDHLTRWLTGKGLRMGPQQEQTIDLMGLVYEYLRQELQVAAVVRNLFEQLQIPLLRVAVQDESFFSDHGHPARQFFNTVADASELWLDDAPERSPMFQRMRDAVSGIAQDFDDDLSVFNERLEELRKHIALATRKAQLAERRQVEARKGREKLAIARERAKTITDQLIERYDPPDFARTLIQEAWADYLALLHLRKGEESAEWEQAVMAAKFIAVALHGRLSAALAEQLKKRLPGVTEELTRGLAQVGYGHEEVERVVDRMDKAIQWALKRDPGEAPPQDFEEPMPAPAARADIPRTPPAEDRKRAEQELSEGERQELARLRLVPFGTWFEIAREKNGPWLKRKLSWFSPVSGTALLTDNQGQGTEMKLVDLAKLVHNGQARRFDPQQRPLLDRALNAVLSRLKKMAGSPA